MPIKFFNALTPGRTLAALGTAILIVRFLSGEKEIFVSAVQAFFSKGLFLTVGTVWLVMVIETELKHLGLVETFVLRLPAKRTKAVLWLAPAILGLIPAVAGARLSTGLVAALGKKTKSPPSRLAAVNFWFRHINVFCNPLIPGTILAAGISGVPLGEIVFQGVPLAILALVFGLFFLIRTIRSDAEDPAEAPEHSIAASAFSREGKFFAVSLALAVLLAFPDLLPLPLLLAVPAAAGAFACLKAFKLSIAAYFLLAGKERHLLIELALILWFAASLKVAGLLDWCSSQLLSASIPQGPALLFAAFSVSLATGVSISSVAITMPLAASLYPGDPFIAFCVVGIGFVAQFLTPTHLCLTVSAENFGVPVSSVVRHILVPLTATCLTGWGVLLLLH